MRKKDSYSKPAVAGLVFNKINNTSAVGNLEFNNMSKRPSVVSRQLVKLKNGAIATLIILSNGKRLIEPIRR